MAPPAPGAVLAAGPRLRRGRAGVDGDGHRARAGGASVWTGGGGCPDGVGERGAGRGGPRGAASLSGARRGRPRRGVTVRPGPDPKATRWIAIRVGVVALLFLAGFGAVAWRAVQLQVVQRDRLSAEARDQYLRQFVMQPRRGVVTDRAGQLLARSADAESVFVDPEELAPTGPAPRRPGRWPRPRPRLEGAAQGVDRGSRFVWAKRRVSPAEAGAVRSWPPRRQLGGRDPALLPEGHAGRAGARRHRRRGLRPRRRGAGARRPAARRADPRPLAARRRGAGPPPGRPRLDARARGGAGRADHRPGAAAGHRAGADAAVRGSRALSGVAVALDPATGEVLAMASDPPVNPNAPRTRRGAAQPGRHRRLRARLHHQDLHHRRGAGARRAQARRRHRLQRRLHRGWARHPRPPGRSAGRGPSKVLAASSNVGAARIGARLGKQGLSEVLASFGFGERAGIDLPGERRGSSPSPAPTSPWPPRASARGSPPAPCRWSPPCRPSPTAARS